LGTYGWEYNNRAHQAITWYPNGNILRLFYETDDKKFLIIDYSYENGKPKQKNQSIEPAFFNENHKKAKGPFDSTLVGKQLLYHENGKVKEERCYTLTLQKDNTLKNEMCGPEIFYDETGKEIKRIEHNAKCEYGCDEVPRIGVEKLLADIKAYKNKIRTRSLVRLPVVGKIASINQSSKEIEIAYKPGFALNTGDLVCCLVDDQVVSFECKNNNNGTGRFQLKEDKSKKYSSISNDTEPRFYKKNEIKYDDSLKSWSKAKAGDVKVIGGIEFVYIPGGEYFQNDYKNPKTGINKKMVAFWMTKYEVTLGEFLKYCYEDNIKLPDNNTGFILNSTYPVNIGSHLGDATAFCSWFEIKHGVKTELPDLHEWEYAARGGTSTPYYWGNGKISDYCWYKKNSGGKLHPAGQKKPNAFGLYDMIGNAWEWCRPYDLRGGSCRSDEADLQYGTSYVINYEYLDDLGDKGYINKTGQGTSFRMIIRVP